MSSALAPPLINGRYRRTSLIASGGMGEVWLGTDQVLGRDVAIKVLRPEYANSEEFRARFRAEARAVAAVSHPSVVGIYDYGEAPDPSGHVAYLVMEYVDGTSVADLLSETTVLAPEMVADLVAETAIGLDAAHECGLVHRDIKPANLLLPADGAVKIVDFGIARSASDTVALTRTGMIVGTAHYMSPEQAAGHRATAASDLYSLGAVAYACLAGRPPFQRESEVAVAMAHVSDIPDPLPAAVPVELRDLVMALLAKDPADRPPAAEVSSRATALRAGVSAHTVAMPQPTKVLPSAVAESVATGATSSRRRGWYLLAGGMAGVLLLALVIAALTGPAVTKLQAPTSTNRTPAAKTASTVGSHPGVRIVESRYIGMTAADAMTVLRAIGVVPTQVRRSSSLPAGTVIGISPHGRVARGSAVKVYVAKAEAPTPPQQLPPGQAKKVGHGGPGPGGHGHDGKGGTPGG